MSAAEVAQLEDHLSKEPGDMEARTKLLGYYQMRRFGPDGNPTKRNENILWIIQHHPEAEIAGLPQTFIDPKLDASGYEQAKTAWLDAVKQHPQNASVLGNAAHFFLISEHKQAEELLEKAIQAAPDDPKWADKLAEVHTLAGADKSADEGRKALEQLERAQKLDNRPLSRFYRLDKLAKAAYAAGDLQKASQYASDLLAQAAKSEGNWNVGNAIHHGNLVLGRIALKNGDVKAACDYLLKSGKTPGSPTLRSFGPNMSLAKELLQKGEKETVLKYFDLCENFWKDSTGKLGLWKTDVQAGKIPNFGANLVY